MRFMIRLLAVFLFFKLVGRNNSPQRLGYDPCNLVYPDDIYYQENDWHYSPERVQMEENRA
eukprot:gene25978-2188_t